MSKTIKLKRGFDIKLKGHPEEKILSTFKSATYAVRPPDFVGIRPIPKLMVEVGDEVLAGDAVFFDKPNPEIFYCSPVSGEVVDIKRGAKRAIEEVVILADEKVAFKNFDKKNPGSCNREEIIANLKEAGCWPFIKQRPYNVIANAEIAPRDIFVSCFDTNPLAPNIEFALKSDLSDFQIGIDVLKKLTDGSVYLGVDDANSAFANMSGAEINIFSGPHPAGNVGVQIHHISAINKGETVWTISPYDVVLFGRLFNKGTYDTKRLISVGGPPVKAPQYIPTYIGASVDAALDQNITSKNIRVVSGSALSGTKMSVGQHISALVNSVSVLEEGDFYELLGWILPSYPRPSLSPTIPPFELTTKFPFIKKVERFNANTNTHGEKRAFVVTGQYESVVPMDIYPQALLRAILSKDFDMMEGLGIYEVVEEDLALCEFVCTSKFNVQETLREGLELLREQG